MLDSTLVEIAKVLPLSSQIATVRAMSSEEDFWSKPTTLIRTVNDPAVVLVNEIPVHETFDVEHYNEPDWPCDVGLTVEVDPDDGPVATSVRTIRRPDGRRVSVAVGYKLLTKKAPLSHWVKVGVVQSAGEVARRRLLGTDPGLGESSRRDELGAHIADAMGGATPATRKRARRYVTDAFLQEVATVYQQAVTDGLSPLQAVSDAMHASHSSANRWAGLSRSRGFLTSNDKKGK